MSFVEGISGILTLFIGIIGSLLTILGCLGVIFAGFAGFTGNVEAAIGIVIGSILAIVVGGALGNYCKNGGRW